MSLISEEKPAKQKKERRALDKYYTPAWATQALVNEFPEVRGDLLFDPCCGDGRMLDALGVHFDAREGNDVDLYAAGRFRGDATRPETWQQVRFRSMSWVVTNPPFNTASQIAWNALQYCQNVALLLRITFLEPVESRQWLTSRPPDAQLVLPRISFDGSGQTDSTTCAWFVWSPQVQPRIRVVRANEIGQLKLTGAA